jgi:hypothetical protein
MKTPDFDTAIRWLNQEQDSLQDTVARLENELHSHVIDLALSIGSDEHEKKVAKQLMIESLVAELEVTNRTLNMIDHNRAISELTERQAAEANTPEEVAA